jgi:HAD domain in Swiss Army Knife RNA repair proteins
MAHGLLLLDVDGPLNPYAAKPHARPPGYETFRLTPSGEWHTGREARRRGGVRVWLNPGHGALLRGLAAECGLELAWATTWLHEANTRIGPAIGLPELPVIEFPDADLDDQHGWRGDGAWKWPAVARFAAGRPLAWLDDEHGTERFRRARSAFDRARAGAPTLLCHVDPRQGLRPEHLAAVRTWADTLPEPG